MKVRAFVRLTADFPPSPEAVTFSPNLGARREPGAVAPFSFLSCAPFIESVKEHPVEKTRMANSQGNRQLVICRYRFNKLFKPCQISQLPSMLS